MTDNRITTSFYLGVLTGIVIIVLLLKNDGKTGDDGNLHLLPRKRTA